MLDVDRGLNISILCSVSMISKNNSFVPQLFVPLLNMYYCIPLRKLIRNIDICSYCAEYPEVK